MEEIACRSREVLVVAIHWVQRVFAAVVSAGSSPVFDKADTDKQEGVRCQRTWIVVRWL
jgi:hypothetical protein